MSASFALLDIMGQNTVTEQHLLHALVNGMLTINHAAGTEEGILSEDITYEELCRRFEYIAWPAGLGTLEENPTLWRVRDEPDDFYE